MLFQRHILERIATGTITCAFRLWRKPTVRSGGTLKTAIGVLRIIGVEPIAARDISDRDARRAGYAGADDVRRAFPPESGRMLYRISFHLDGPDPRVRLRADDRLDAAVLADVEKCLARLDRRDSGPWTLAYLQLIADSPGVLAATLAKQVGCQRDAFKRDVRKLKEMGLTESLEVGYRISPRGRAVLGCVSRRARERVRE